MAEKRRVRVDTGEPVARPDFGQEGGKARAAQPEPPPPDPEACSCPRLDRDEWHEVESNWDGLAFVSTTLNAAMGVPLGYQGAREKLAASAAALGATVPEDAMLLIGEGKFRRPVMLEIEDAPETGKGVVRPGGVAYSRLVPAPLGAMKKVVEDTAKIATARYGRKPDAMWLWYLTCRICSAPRDFETLVIAFYADGGQRRSGQRVD